MSRRNGIENKIVINLRGLCLLCLFKIPPIV